MQTVREYTIDEHIVGDLKTWFEEYISSFSMRDPDLRQNILLKKEHTARVVEEIVSVGTKLGLDESEIALAEVTALFHDIGRFEQYLRYRTFVDSKSVNHAEFGVKILQQRNVLVGMNPPTRSLVLKVIAFHNRAHLRDIEDPVCLFYTRLLRDADKLDIYRVVTEYYTGTKAEKNKAVELDLPDTPEISGEVFRDVMAQRVIEHTQLKTLNDFKLLQLAWIFDINFAPTLRRVCDRGYLQMILNTLPDVPQTQEISQVIDTYLRKRTAVTRNGSAVS